MDIMIVVCMIAGVCTVPVIMLFAAHIMRLVAQSDRNSLIGYRTRLSMSTPEAWTYANNYCAKLWTRIGRYMIVLSPCAVLVAVFMLAVPMSELGSVVLAITVLQVACMLASIYATEKKLRALFETKQA